MNLPGLVGEIGDVAGVVWSKCWAEIRDEGCSTVVSRVVSCVFEEMSCRVRHS